MHKFSDSPAQNWENPVLLLEKSLKRCPSLHFHMDVKWPFPRQKSLSSVPSGTTPHWMYHRAAFQQDSRMIPFHGQPQTIKCLKPCLHRRLDGAYHSSYLLRSFHQPSHISRMPHTWTLLLSIHSNTSQNWTLQKLAGSLDDWKKFFTAFRKWMISILFATN